jgi:hypothetical protein
MKMKYLLIGLKTIWSLLKAIPLTKIKINKMIYKKKEVLKIKHKIILITITFKLAE